MYFKALPPVRLKEQTLTKVDEYLAKLAIKKRLIKFFAEQAWADEDWPK